MSAVAWIACGLSVAFAVFAGAWALCAAAALGDEQIAACRDAATETTRSTDPMGEPEDAR